jgi:biopolymer transport protein ExbD
MVSLRSKKKTSAEIPTASMADIAFLLIIFFMTTTIFASEKGLKMLLPEKGEQVKIASRNIMQILVSPEGKVLVEEESGALKEYDLSLETQRDQLRKEVEMALERTSDSISVAIKVSRLAPYSIMIDVLDEVKRADAKRISLVPLSEEEGGGE